MNNKYLTVFFVLAIFSQMALAAVQLPGYNIDPKEVTVSGLSSGAFFSVQMHVAYSSSIKGAGAIAGGPYYCAEGSVTSATTACMSSPTMIKLNNLISSTQSWSTAGTIDKIDNLKDAPVCLLWGSKDTVVNGGVMDKLTEYYRAFDAKVTYRKDLAFGHGFPTLNYGNTCSSSKAPYMNNCGFEGAELILKAMYGDNLNARSTKLQGTFVEFDQSAFFSSSKAYGLAKTGWAYVPDQCAKGQRCKLHIVFHGCVQSVSSVGDVVYKYSGYNEWAETNDIVVLYPQTGATGNTNGCWDWWGDQGDKVNYAKRSGPQMAIIKRMIDRAISGTSNPGATSNPGQATTKPSGPVPYGACYHASNVAHVSDGRAYHNLGVAYAKGSGQYMGLWNIFDYTYLRLTDNEYYIVDRTCA